MKIKEFIVPMIFFLIGMIFVIFGALFKILHWQLGPVSAPLLLAIGSVVQVIGCVFAIFILISHLFKK